jgi:hypothetical protein
MAVSRYDTSLKVKQEVIDRIKKMGQKAATEAANSGKESAEFVEGSKRMYGNKVGASNTANLAKRQQETKTSGRAAPSVGDKESGAPTVTMPPSAKASATRRVQPKGMAQGLGAPTANKPVKGNRLLAQLARQKAPQTGESTANFVPKTKKAKKAKKSSAFERAVKR